MRGAFVRGFVKHAAPFAALLLLGGCVNLGGGKPPKQLISLTPAASAPAGDLGAASLQDALVVLDRSFFEPWSADYYDRPTRLDPRLAEAAAPAGWRLLFEVQALALERQTASVQTFRVP